jgi:hypothetical protein
MTGFAAGAGLAGRGALGRAALGRAALGRAALGRLALSARGSPAALLRALAGSAAARFLVVAPARRSATTVLAFSTDLLAASLLRAAGRLVDFFTLAGFGAGFLADIGDSSKASAL